jgi:hypothetical protein
LDRKIKKSIFEDRKKRIKEAGMAIEAALTKDGFNQKAAYNIAKQWYRHMGDRPPKPSRQDLTTTANAFKTLYQLKEPEGDPIPTHIHPTPVDDDIPTEEEIAEAIDRLKCNKATGPSRMRAEHFHQWYNMAYPPTTRKEGDKPAESQPGNWMALVHLTQRIFATGQLPTEINWSFLTLIPKPHGGSRGIGLLETLWKLVEAIIDTRIKRTVQIHDALHGF